MTNCITEILDQIHGTPRPDEVLVRQILALTDPHEIEALYTYAYEVKRREVTPTVYFRGLIELSNICTKDCLYCGIRRSRHVHRYTLTPEEVLACAKFAFDNEYGSIVLQSGERTDQTFVDSITEIIRKIVTETSGKLAITLSLGEQSQETYRRWFEAGAHRYLLRIETSSRALYGKLHPPDHSYDDRLRCLRDLREMGYHVGTGVMIGLPFQTLDDLANDILFFVDHDIDMIGMGPYLPHHDTPLTSDPTASIPSDPERLQLALKMIALARIVMKDINIASTTALQTLDPLGRELGLKAGANVIMPNLTPVKYRQDYLLYDNKPCLDEDAEQCKGCLARRIEGIGERIGWGKSGDPLHAIKRHAAAR